MATNPQRTQFGSLGFVEVVFLGPMYLEFKANKKINPFPAFPLVKCSKYLQEIQKLRLPYRVPFGRLLRQTWIQPSNFQNVAMENVCV